MGDFDVDVGEVIGRFDRLEPLAHMIQPEVVEESRRVRLKTAGRRFEIDRLGLGPLAGSLPFQEQAALVAVEHLSKLRFAGFSTRLAPDERPVRILESVGYVDRRRAVPKSQWGRRSGCFDGKRCLAIGVQTPEDSAKLMCPAVPDLAAAGLH